MGSNFLLNTVLAMIDYLHIMQGSTFKIFYAIYLGVTELENDSWN
jgi:hypothetical protein